MVKKVVVLLAVAFAVFYVLTRPEAAGNAVQATASFIGTGFENLIRFLASLFS